MAIIVVVEKSSRCRPSARFNARLLCYIGKRPIAIVMVEDVLSITCYVDIWIAIVVIVSDSHSHAIVTIACVGQPGGFGNVGKCSVLVLPVKPIPVLWVAPIE